MELLANFIDIFMHLDKHLSAIIHDYGSLTYLILFLIIFCETGLVVTPLLPGDSLLFAAGTFAATGALDTYYLFLLLSAAAIAGDTVNYGAGNYLAPRMFNKNNARFLNREYLERTHKFYEKYGGKTIIIARFIPIIRTFAPFVAGMGSMAYMRFLAFNAIGGFVWIGLFIFGGYYFGNIPFVKNNFSMVIVAIIIISVMPAVVEVLRHRFSGDSGKV